MTVAADGRLGSPALQRSSGNDDLDRAAIEAVSTWRFNPRICDGKAVDGEVFIPVEFNLDGWDAAKAQANPASPKNDPIAEHRNVRIVEDESPIPFATAAATLKFLEREDGVLKGRAQTLDETTTMKYYLLPRERETFDVLESSEFGWNVVGGGAASVLRVRYAHEGTALILLYSHLCDGPEQWCKRVLGMRLATMQQDPPPEPPPAPQ